MKRVLSFALGLFFGAMTGVVVVLLITPQSGSELQQSILQRWREVLNEARQAGASRRAEIATQFPVTQPTRE
ncbi:MAG: YtxH domain-containing protein [Chloroflexota bacterium]